MANIDWSATASWITLGVAILSPVITTALNNHFHIKRLRHEQDFETRKADADYARDKLVAVFENYVNSAGIVGESDPMFPGNSENMSIFIRDHNIAYLYSVEGTRQLMKLYYDIVISPAQGIDYDGRRKLLDSICDSIMLNDMPLLERREAL